VYFFIGTSFVFQGYLNLSGVPLHSRIYRDLMAYKRKQEIPSRPP